MTALVSARHLRRLKYCVMTKSDVPPIQVDIRFNHRFSQLCDINWFSCSHIIWCCFWSLIWLTGCFDGNSLTHWGQDRFADDIFKCIFLNENVSVAIKISLKFVPKGPISNIPALVQIMARRRPSDKPLSEPMMVSLPTHICITRPQWVNK